MGNSAESHPLGDRLFPSQSGDKEGQTELTGGKSRSSIYKFDGDSVFHTIGGFRQDDEEGPTLIRWEKVKE